MNLVKAVKELVDAHERVVNDLRVAQTLLNLRARVCVGDTWMYVANWQPPRRADKRTGRKAHRGYAAVDVVKSVNRREDRVTFEDGGWSDLKSMETDPNWVLLGRVYTPGDEKPLGRKARREGLTWRR